MSADLVLKNGLVIVEGKPVVRSVAISSGKIDGIFIGNDVPSGKETIDCDGNYILPGAIDIHVHLRDLSREDKEDFSTGTKAAAAGGVTTVLDMPNSQPPTLSWNALREKISRARERRYVNIGFYGGIPFSIEDFDTEMVPHIHGLKVYPHSPLLAEVKFTSNRIRESMKLAKTHRIPLLFHPDVASTEDQPVTHDEFFKRHSCENEVESIRNFIRIREQVDCRLHVCHVSCAKSAELIAANRAESSLTAEVTPHHLLLQRDSFSHHNGVAKMLPPLRTKNDNNELWQYLQRCAIDCVATDHAPHTWGEKSAKFKYAPSGISGLETMVPILLTEVFDGNLSWVEYLRYCCSGPARIMHLREKGVLTKGYDADIVVIEKGEWRIEGKDFYSKSKLTPFEGRIIKAKPIHTIVRGDVVYSHGNFPIGPGYAGHVPVASII
ncbi:MAG: amidohydrolase family protein [Candidatus Lokiarchaeota archaeon]|nr:amidohydrolase family protein [Candidatus Lokiarchaeota archaeon]